MANYKFTGTKNRYAVIAGRRVASARKACAYTQEQLSQATGGTITASRLANYEQGTRELGIRESIILGEALQQPPSYLLGVVDEIDRDILRLPAETKIALLSAFRAATPG